MVLNPFEIKQNMIMLAQSVSFISYFHFNIGVWYSYWVWIQATTLMIKSVEELKRDLEATKKHVDEELKRKD